jgi:hypothetical protein
MRSRGLRVTAGLTPKLHEVLLATAQRLHLSVEPEAYVLPDPSPNAYAPIFGTQDRPLLILNSGIVELLCPSELQFVIGHELGHLGLGHPGMPENDHFNNELEKLKRLSVSRASEISADRVGLIATSSLVISANVKIKLASGLSSSHLRPDVESFLRQLDRDGDQSSHEWELYQIHPSLPLRLWALIQFSKTDIYARMTQQGMSGVDLQEADRVISERLAALGDGKLSKMEQESFDLAVLWLGAALVFDDEIIEDHEREMLKSLVDEELAQKALTFAEQHGLKAVLDKLNAALGRLDLNDSRIFNKIKNTYDMFIQRVNIAEDRPKAYSILRRFM